MGRTSTARLRLVDSVSELIHASNCASASVDDLCAARGVSKGSFYYFFPSKRDLTLAALEAQWAGAREHVLEPAFQADLSPLERIPRFFRRVAEVQQTSVVRGCPFGNLAVELGTLDDALRDKVAEILEGYRGYFERALQEAVTSGDVVPLDVVRASRALLAYFQGAMVLAKTFNDASIIEQLGEQAVWLAGDLPLTITDHSPRNIRKHLQKP